MFTGLNTHVGFSGSGIPKNEFIVVYDSRADGSFLIHHFVSCHLRAGGNVCMLGLVQIFSHYRCASQKLGLNLQAHQEEGRFVFIDGLMLIAEAFKCPEKRDKLSAKHIASLIQATVKGRTEPWLVVVDDLSALLNIGISVDELADLVHHFKVCTCYEDVAVLTLTHCDSDVDDPDMDMLLNQLKHHSTLNIQVSGLRTGYSRDVHGEMTITRPRLANRPTPSRQVLHFKLLDKDVKLFAPGTSSAVL